MLHLEERYTWRDCPLIPKLPLLSQNCGNLAFGLKARNIIQWESLKTSTTVSTLCTGRRGHVNFTMTRIRWLEKSHITLLQGISFAMVIVLARPLRHSMDNAILILRWFIRIVLFIKTPKGSGRLFSPLVTISQCICPKDFRSTRLNSKLSRWQSISLWKKTLFYYRFPPILKVNSIF